MAVVSLLNARIDSWLKPGFQDVDDKRRQLPVAALESEGGINTVSVEDQHARLKLVQSLRALPKDALLTMRHFQPQVGCLNRCSFCSQSAGSTLWHLPRGALANLVAALKTVALEHAIEDGVVTDTPLTDEGVFDKGFSMPEFGLIGSKRSDRPGVLYCYLDNDPAAYPHLDDLIEWLHVDLGVKIRIATVGYSRKNPAMQKMHARISRELSASIAGFRLSFSPYSYGWTAAAERVGAATRTDFELDTANLLDTYRGIFLSDRIGRKGACVELRFKPLVVSTEVAIDKVHAHAVIRSGPYLVVSKERGGFPPVARIRDPHSHAMELSEPGYPSWMVYGNEENLNSSWETLVDRLINGGAVPDSFAVQTVLLHSMVNDDGHYFAVDAERQASGIYSKFFYPKTARRVGSGYIDGERYFLNALIGAKKNGLDTSWDDISNVIEGLHAKARTIEEVDETAAQYILGQVIAVVESYAKALNIANFPAQVFFDRRLTVDTGHICNLGRAFHEYKAIASRPDLPLTPNHERAFGTSGELAQEGITWRLAVSPVNGNTDTAGARGNRNSFRREPSILVEELDLSMTATVTGQSRAQYFIPIQNIERLSVHETRAFPIVPGHK